MLIQIEIHKLVKHKICSKAITRSIISQEKANETSYMEFSEKRAAMRNVATAAIKYSTLYGELNSQAAKHLDILPMHF